MVSMEKPEELVLVVAFLNTLDHEGGADALAEPDGLGSWLRACGLGHAMTVSPATLAGAVELREAIRAALAPVPAPRSSGRLAEACRRYPLRVGDPAAGEPVLVPVGDAGGAPVGRGRRRSGPRPHAGYL